jgi:integrase
VHPGRYETASPISMATLNRVIDSTVKLIRDDGTDSDPFTVHDLRRTASTLLHEAEFNTDWIEKCLAHEQRGVRAVYNKAEYADRGGRCSRRGQICSTAGLLRIQRRAS